MASNSISAQWQGLRTRSLHAETPTTPPACRRLGCRRPAAFPALPWRSVALLSACLEPAPAPSSPLCAPGRLPFALRCSLAAHARTALRLAVVLVHRSWRLKLMHPPPPPTSPPRLRTPRCHLCSRQESSRHTGGPASVARACRAASLSSLSHRHKVRRWRYEAPEGQSALVLQEASPAPGIFGIQGGRAGIVVSSPLRIALNQTRGINKSCAQHELQIACYACMLFWVGR